MYKAGKPRLNGTCEPKVLLPLSWRRSSGETQAIQVERFYEGLVFIEVPALSTGCVWVLVDTSMDLQRWAVRCESRPVSEPGRSVLPVNNLGRYLRLRYRIEGAAQLGLEWLGKTFVVGPGDWQHAMAQRQHSHS